MARMLAFCPRVSICRSLSFQKWWAKTSHSFVRVGTCTRMCVCTHARARVRACENKPPKGVDFSLLSVPCSQCLGEWPVHESCFVGGVEWVIIACVKKYQCENYKNISFPAFPETTLILVFKNDFSNMKYPVSGLGKPFVTTSILSSAGMLWPRGTNA